MNNKINSFDNVFSRLVGLGVTSQKELAGILGVTPGAISDAKRRGAFPKKWAVVLSKTYNIGVDRVLGLSMPDAKSPGEGDSKDAIIQIQGKLLDAKDEALSLQKKLLDEKDKNSRLQKEISRLKRKEEFSPLGVYVDGSGGQAWIPSAGLEDDAPDFTAKSTLGEIDFHEYLGDSWGILFSHPKDYTPVCTTEFGQVAKLKGEFKKLNVKVLSLTVDSLESHLGWIKDINETQGCTVDFPIIADVDRKVARLYNMIRLNSEDNVTVRSVFIISPKKKIALILTYPLSTGRCFKEILRALKSLQLTDKHQVATPADWQSGDDCLILPSVKQEDIPKKFPNAHKAIKPYLRYTPQPSMTE